MSEARLQLVIDALNEASDELKQLQGDLTDTGENARQMKDSNESAKLSFTELNSAVSLGKQAFAMLGQAYQAVIAPTLAYAGQVRELGRTIGATAEESSKLIQAADDVGVSAESLQGALEVAIRKGISPTIDGIGALADQYNAIQDPIERSKFLMDNFGRSGADLAPLMEKGAAGIAALGQAAEDTGLVLSQTSVDAARKYEIALDNAGDSVNGLKYKVGGVLLPVLTDTITTLGKVKLAFGFDDIIGIVSHAVEVNSQAYKDNVAAAVALTDASDRLDLTTTGLSATLDDNAAAEERNQEAKEHAKTITDLLKGSADLYQKSLADVRQRVEDEKAAHDAFNSTTAQNAIQALKDLKVDADLYTAALVAQQTWLGTNDAALAGNRSAVASITQAYADGVISKDAYGKALSDLADGPMRVAQQAAENAAGAVAGVGGSLQYLNGQNATVTITTIHDDVYQQHGGGGNNGRAAGGPVTGGMAYPWNEPGAGPEILVPAGNGYVLNRQQAQEALAGAVSGGGDNNAELLATLAQLPSMIASAVSSAMQLGRA